MPWSGGVYTRGYASWSSDASLNLPISATKFDTEDNDFASGLNNCLTKDGLNTPSAAMTWGLGAAQVLALTRGNDGTVFSTARTGGATNPALTASVVDASGVNLNLSAGTTLALQVAGTNVLAIAAGSITLSQPALEANGTAAAPSFAFTSATGTGLYRPAANTLGFTANGVAAGSIAATGAWNIPAPGSGAVALTVNGIANSYTGLFSASSTASQSFGLRVQAGTNSSDVALAVNNQANTLTYGLINGDGSGTLGYNGSGATIKFAANGVTTVTSPAGGKTLDIVGSAAGNSNSAYIQLSDSGDVQQMYLGKQSGSSSSIGLVNTISGGLLQFQASGGGAIQGFGPTAAAYVDMTPDTGTFTGALTGCTAGINVSCRWARNGNHVKLTIGAGTGTSNAVTMSMTGLPAAIQPATTQICGVGAGAMSNNSAVVQSGSSAQVTASSGTVTFLNAGNALGFTNVNGKGVNAAFTISYHLF